MPGKSKQKVRGLPAWVLSSQAYQEPLQGLCVMSPMIRRLYWSKTTNILETKTVVGTRQSLQFILDFFLASPQIFVYWTCNWLNIYTYMYARVHELYKHTHVAITLIGIEEVLSQVSARTKMSGGLVTWHTYSFQEQFAMIAQTNVYVWRIGTNFILALFLPSGSVLIVSVTANVIPTWIYVRPSSGIILSTCESTFTSSRGRLIYLFILLVWRRWRATIMRSTTRPRCLASAALNHDEWVK